MIFTVMGDVSSNRFSVVLLLIVDVFVLQVQQKQLIVSGRIFTVETVRAKGNMLKLRVNFMPEIITLAKEVGGSGPNVYDLYWNESERKEM